MGGHERLAEEVLVVRCGRPPFDQPKFLNERCDLHDGVYGFSVQSGNGRTLIELSAWCRNNKIGVSTVRQIRSSGYEVVITAGEGYHATVVVPPDWDQVAAMELGGSFQERENPVPKAERHR